MNYSFVIALAFFFAAGVLAYFRVRTMHRQREEKRRDALQAARIRMAERLIAGNGGRPLSAHKGGIMKD